MKRKLLSLLISAAMLIGAMPAVSFADGASAGAKFGAEKGDIVLFAGKDGTPIKWRVIDSENTNTDQPNSMFLLSEDTLYDVTSTEKGVGWQNQDCNDFYDAYFGDSDKDAVRTVSKTDSTYKIGLDSYTGNLPEGTAVFALSAEELESLPDNLKKFTGSSDWWLRSVCTSPLSTNPLFTYYTYAAADTGKIGYYLSRAYDVKLRPAVNLDKFKLAGIDEKILLLPVGNFADNTLSPVGTASEWKLSTKTNDSDNGLVMVYSLNNTDTGLTLQLKTTQQPYITPYGSNDYVSLIIVKADGTISHYGRYALTGNSTTHTFSIELPSGIDTENDTMYAFCENYRGEMAGAISTPKVVCFKHKYTYENPNDNYHRGTCSVCGYQKAEQHNFGDYTDNGTDHMRTCSDCGFVKTENHSITYYTPNDAKTHNASCVCGYTAENPEEHTYDGKISGSPVDFTCSRCGATYFTALAGMFGDLTLRDEYKAGSAAVNGVKSAWADSIFTDNSVSAAVSPDSTGAAALTFETECQVRAKGFQIKINAQDAASLPKTISLFGKNADNVYEEIGTAALRSIVDGENAGGTYSFAFSANSGFKAYDSFKADMDLDIGTSADVAYFGLISEPAHAAVNLNLTGILATYAPDLMYPGEDYTASFISGTGYPKSLSVREDNKTFNGDYWEYSRETGIMKIFSQYINEGSVYEIYGYCGDTVTVMFNSQTLKLTNNNRDALFGQEYVAEFEVISGNKNLAPKSLDDITVTNKNGDITHLCTLDSDGRLHIPGELLVGGSGDSIKISAEEAGRKLSPEEAAVKVVKDDKIDRYFSSMDNAKAVIELDGDTDITFLKDADSSETVTVSGKNVNIDLGGNTVTARADGEIFNIKNGAQVSISNGTFAADGADTVIRTDADGVLTLNNVITPQNEKSVLVYYLGKLILDGANSDVTVYLHDGTFEQKNGTSRLSSAKTLMGNVKLYGGTVAECNVGKTDMFALIDDGYVFELSDESDFEDFARGVIFKPFSVKKGNIITAQPQDISVELGENGRLTIGAADGSSYYWFDADDCAKGMSYTNYLEIGAELPVGEYSYCCAVLTGNTVSGSRTAKVTVTCSHKSVTNGVCDGCGAEVAAQVTANGRTQAFGNIYDAFAFAGENETSAVKLLDDVSINDYVDVDGKNITLDMNGKTFASNNTNRFIRVSGNGVFTVAGNGNMTARIYADDKGGVIIENGSFAEVGAGYGGDVTVNGGTFKQLSSSGGAVTVNDGTVKKLSVNNGITVLNGGRFDEISATDFYKLLPEGKAFAGADDGKFNTAAYEYYEGDDNCIKNVIIKDVPFVITKQPKGGFVAEGTKNAQVSAGVVKNDAYAGQIVYKWVFGTIDYRGEFTVENENAGNAAAALVDTAVSAGGAQRTYQCTVSYEGYELKTDCATFIIGKGEPAVNFDVGYIESKGNDCTVVAAVYNGSEFLTAAAARLNKDDAFTDIDTLFNPLFEKLDEDTEFDEMKLFFWDSIGSMKPICKAIDVLKNQDR